MSYTTIQCVYSVQWYKRSSVTSPGPGVTMKFPKRFKFLFKFNCHHKHLHFVFKYDERTNYKKVYGEDGAKKGNPFPFGKSNFRTLVAAAAAAAA